MIRTTPDGMQDEKSVPIGDGIPTIVLFVLFIMLSSKESLKML